MTFERSRTANRGGFLGAEEQNFLNIFHLGDTYCNIDQPPCRRCRMPRTLFSLFWSMFGLVGVESVEIKYPTKEQGDKYAYSFPGGSHATSIVEGVGLFLFALYHVAIIIVLTNMLIAMMSHSFEDIQVRRSHLYKTGYILLITYCYNRKLLFKLNIYKHLYIYIHIYIYI